MFLIFFFVFFVKLSFENINKKIQNVNFINLNSSKTFPKLLKVEKKWRNQQVTISLAFSRPLGIFTPIIARPSSGLLNVCSIYFEGLDFPVFIILLPNKTFYFSGKFYRAKNIHELVENPFADFFFRSETLFEYRKMNKMRLNPFWRLFDLIYFDDCDYMLTYL